LNNVVRHSGAGMAQIVFTCQEPEFSISIRDNGRGFEAATVVEGAEGNGLRNMKYRLQQLGGRCSIESAPGAGTCVTFTVRTLPEAARHPEAPKVHP